MSTCPGIIMPCGDACILAGYGFVAIQNPTRVYEYAAAFVNGTIFPDLNIPKGKYGPKENFFEGMAGVSAMMGTSANR